MRSLAIGVWLVLRGPQLEHTLVSNILNLEPSVKLVRGQPRPEFPAAIAKNGLWSLESSVNSDCVVDHVQDILSKLEKCSCDLSQIAGVADAFLDIFVSESDLNGERLTVSFVIDADQIKRLAELGLAVQYTS